MPSKKSRYIRAESFHQDQVRSSALRNALQNQVDNLSEGELREQLYSLIAKDEYNFYLAAAALLPLDAPAVDMLLKGICEQLTENTGGYSKEDEEKLCHLSYALIDRSDKLAKTSSVLLAAEILLVTLINMEAQLEFAEDEGWDLQVVIEECFASLVFMGDEKYEALTCQELKKLIDKYRQQHDDDDFGCYDTEWQLVSDKFGKLG